MIGEEEGENTHDAYNINRSSMGRNVNDMRRTRYNNEIQGRDRDFLSSHYKSLFTASFILILIAIIIMASSKYPNAPNEDDYDDFDEYKKASRTFNNIVGDVQNTADMIFTIGIVLLCFLLFMAPFIDLDLSPVMRIVMIAVGLIMITHFLNDGFNLQVVFG